MQTLRQRLTSRKFLLTIAAIFSAIGAALAGEISWANAIGAVVVAIIPFILGESYRDAVVDKAVIVQSAQAGDLGVPDSIDPLSSANIVDSEHAG